VARLTAHTLEAAAQVDAVACGRTVLAQTRMFTNRAVRLPDRAESEGDPRAATGAIREARGCLEFVARLEGQVIERHAHIHGHHTEDDDMKRRQREIAAMPDKLSIEEVRLRFYAWSQKSQCARGTGWRPGEE
jgi:hypothetical protein